MREIKFRAWWKHPEYNPDGKMYFVGGMTFATRQDGEPEFDDCGTPKEIGLMSTVNNSKIGWNSADECILMQYTGLKDKNSKEIYEGDIVKGGIRYDFDKNQIGIVKFGKFSSDNSGQEYANNTVVGWYIDIIDYAGEIEENYGNYSWNDLEVIGNIYENPELLK